MARKRRSVEAVNPADGDNKEKVRYVDPFQQRVGKTVEDAGRKLEGKGKTILYGIAALAVLAVIVWIFYAWSSRSNAAAQNALGKAIETSEAQVTDQPLPPGSTAKTFKTEKERAEAAAAQFDAVAQKYGGAIGEKARYFAAVNRLSLDRASAIAELENLSTGNGNVATLAKFALANAKSDDGQLEDAARLYNEIANGGNSVVAKDTVNFALAGVYEKQGKKQEAADLLFNIVKASSEAKGLDGKPLTPSQTSQAAREKLKTLDPERAKQIPESNTGPADSSTEDS